ncbi:MAG: cytochrome C [Planctomycetes bacterium]|nr:cytochrome C [Planctomycetota bacterium]
MKILKPLLMIAGFALAFGSPAISQGLGTGIATTGSPHNFTDDVGANELPGSGGWNGREEICRVCHVPHDHDRATRYGDNGLLWNHEVSSTTYTMYSSATLDGSVASQPTGFSKMCLGCHDGTVGIDTFDKYAGGTVFIQDYNAGFRIPGGTNFAGDLTSTHPISIVYDEVLDPGLNAKTDPMGGSGTIDDVLEGGVLQCSSCHDVHDQPGESVPGTHLLRVNQKASTGTASGLCLTCHIK